MSECSEYNSKSAASATLVLIKEAFVLLAIAFARNRATPLCTQNLGRSLGLIAQSPRVQPSLLRE